MGAPACLQPAPWPLCRGGNSARFSQQHLRRAAARCGCSSLFPQLRCSGGGRPFPRRRQQVGSFPAGRVSTAGSRLGAWPSAQSSGCGNQHDFRSSISAGQRRPVVAAPGDCRGPACCSGGGRPSPRRRQQVRSFPAGACRGPAAGLGPGPSAQSSGCGISTIFAAASSPDSGGPLWLLLAVPAAPLLWRRPALPPSPTTSRILPGRQGLCGRQPAWGLALCPVFRVWNQRDFRSSISAGQRRPVVAAPGDCRGPACCSGGGRPSPRRRQQVRSFPAGACRGPAAGLGPGPSAQSSGCGISTIFAAASSPDSGGPLWLLPAIPAAPACCSGGGRPFPVADNKSGLSRQRGLVAPAAAPEWRQCPWLPMRQVWGGDAGGGLCLLY